MANPEHLEILKQGVRVWNEWRSEHADVRPDLYGTSLGGLDFRGVNLAGANLIYTDFRRASLNLAILSFANLRYTDLSRANLNFANICGADFSGADLSHTTLNNANFRGTNFSDADLSRADLRGTILSNTILYGADLSGADLRGADFKDTRLALTKFVDNDLGEVKGLEAAVHNEPSAIDITTLYKSAGKIPTRFLRGCGLNDWQIEHAKLYQPELDNEEITSILYRVHDMRAHQPMQISPLFISYSHADSPFVNRIETHLRRKGVRFWRDVHHSTSGRLERQVDRAIRLNPTVLLVLSKHSVKSDWVEHEARLARKMEQEMGRDVLCPVTLDAEWKACRWPERLREQIMEYNILDFTGWEDEDKFRRMFSRLLDGLDLFYK